jgi:hypothetical protein
MVAPNRAVQNSTGVAGESLPRDIAPWTVAACRGTGESAWCGSDRTARRQATRLSLPKAACLWHRDDGIARSRSGLRWPCGITGRGICLRRFAYASAVDDRSHACGCGDAGRGLAGRRAAGWAAGGSVDYRDRSPLGERFGARVDQVAAAQSIRILRGCLW